MQLVAYGAQDVYLTGSPQITFFKVIYRRHTNFAVEPIPQTFTGTADFGRTVTCTINRNGDLITNMYAYISLPKFEGDAAVRWGFVRRLGLALLRHYKIEIGGSKIDEQYGDWINIWWELSHKVGQERGFSKMVGDVPELTNIDTRTKPEYKLYVPLGFWFNRNNGLALPLIALQYHDVRITIDFRPAGECININYYDMDNLGNVSLQDAQLVIDYVYLDSEERKRFAQASHEYLIEQLQFTGAETLASTNNKYRLNFNHPCKFLVWAPHLEKYTTGTRFLSYHTDMSNPQVSEIFAKYMWLATREGLEQDGDEWIIRDTNLSSDDIVIPPAINSSIDNYVTAQLVFTQSLGSSGFISANLENVVLLTNNFKMSDISTSVDNLISNYGTSINADFLVQNSVIVQDQFNYGNYLDRSNNPVINAKLQLNGSDRFQMRDGYYFNYVQPYQHFSCTPADGINVYSFALKPEDHQPSGTCNFSRIDNATLQVYTGLDNTTNSTEVSSNYVSEYIGSNSNSIINIYAVNYNVLRVMSGMAGAAYSN